MNNQKLKLQGKYVPYFKIENGYSLKVNNATNTFPIIENYGNVTIETYSYSVTSNIENHGNIVLEDTVPSEIDTTSNLGNLTLNNCNITNSISIEEANITLINCVLDNSVRTYGGNIYLANCTVNNQVSASQKLTISDDTILRSNAKLSGKIISNKTDDEIIKYLSSYNGNYTLKNMNITGNFNYGNLTLINSRIVGVNFYNRGNLVFN